MAKSAFPAHQFNSPFLLKIPSPQKFKSPRVSPSNKRFDHVVSPVAVYIHSSPNTPFTVNVSKNRSSSAPRRNFRDSIDDFRDDAPCVASALPMRVCERSQSVVEVRKSFNLNSY